MQRNTGQAEPKPVKQKGKSRLDYLASEIGFPGRSIIIVTVCLLLYMPAIRGGFVWDDDAMLTNNIVLEKNGLYRSWFTTEQSNYWPITWTSYWLQHKVWGLNPTGYHVINVLIHSACTLLIWYILMQLKIPCAWLAALIFAVHPVNVESVAWISQIKTILSMLFFLAALLCYLRFDEFGQPGMYWLAIGSFVLGVLSKGSIIALPLVLLMCAWWLRGIISRRDLLRSAPFFAVSGVMSCVEIWFQYKCAIGKAVVRTDSFFARLAGAGQAVWFYIYKALLPINLSFVYPRWNIDAKSWFSYMPDAALLILLGLCWWYRRRGGRPLLFMLLYCVVMLLPILGFFNIFFMMYSLVADHYQYVSIIGVIALFVATGYHIAARLGKPGVAVGRILVLFVLATFGMLTWHQCHIYKDAETLWRDTLSKNSSAWIAHNNLGVILLPQGKIDEAIGHYRLVIQATPNDAEAHNNMGRAFELQGRLDDAVSYYLRALEIKPDHAEAHSNLGNVLLQQGKIDQAISHQRQALQLRPNSAEMHNNLGNALQLQGRFDEAISHYRYALQIKPNYADAYNNIGCTFFRQGKVDEAISHYRQALELKPDFAEAHCNLGIALESRGKFNEAISHYRQALQIEQNHARANQALKALLVRMQNSITNK